MSDFLYIERLLVRRMPGFPSGGPTLEDVSSGINLIAGPNASGKTSTARALQHLLWPADGDPEISISGACTVGDDQWHADIDGRRIQWQRQGRSAAPPAVPPRDTRGRYLLSLHELLRDEDEDLAGRIRIESAGGFDVGAAARELGFGAASGRPSRLVNVYREAQDELRGAMRTADELRSDHARMASERWRLTVLEGEAGRVRARETALRVGEARSNLASAEADVASYPNVLAQMDGKEVEALEACRDKISELQDLIVEQRSSAARAAESLDKTGLGDEGVSQRTVKELRRRLADVRERERDVRGLQGEIAALEDDASADEREFPDDVLLRLDDCLRHAEKLRAGEARLDVRMREVEAAEQEELADVDYLRSALDTLRRWLRTGEGGVPTGHLGPIALFVLALILAGLLIANAATSGLLWMVAAAAVVAGLVLFLRSRGAAGSGRDAFEKEARERGFAPESWRIEDVRTRMDELEKALSLAHDVSVRRSHRAGIEAERAEMAKLREALETERAELGALLPFPVESDLSLHAAGTRWVDFVHRRRKRIEQEAKLSHAIAAFGPELETLKNGLSEWGYESEDTAACEAAIEDLADRRERHAEAVRDRDDALRRGRELDDRANSVQSEIDRLFERLGLTGKTRELELRHLAGQVEAYSGAVTHLEIMRRDLERAEKDLETLAESGDPGAATLREREQLDEHELTRELERARVAATEARELGRIIAGTEQKLELARDGHDLEQALAREVEARHELAHQRDLDIEAAVGGAIADWLGQHESTDVRPAVFDRADHVLSEITRGRYRLRLDADAAPGFGAFDTEAEHVRTLDQLSAGTRLQLLLAVRVAFIETQESGVAPPLLMDEVLANSDDTRAQAIIEATVALAEAGRQIFYFTAQADEFARWRNRLQSARTDWKEYVLAAGAAPGPGFEWRATAGSILDVPAPDGMTHDAYGRVLGVQPFDPWSGGIGSLHLWHVLTDSVTLHALMSEGIRTWGQLKSYSERAGEEARLRIQAAKTQAEPGALLCERFAALFRRGRSRPIDRSVLVASGAVSETFLDAVADMAAALGGDAVALLSGLRSGQVERFRSGKCDNLEEYLRVQGYIDDGSPLEPDELLLDVMAESDRLGLEFSRDDCEAFIGRLANGPTSGAP